MQKIVAVISFLIAMSMLVAQGALNESDLIETLSQNGLSVVVNNGTIIAEGPAIMEGETGSVSFVMIFEQNFSMNGVFVYDERPYPQKMGEIKVGTTSFFPDEMRIEGKSVWFSASSERGDF